MKYFIIASNIILFTTFSFSKPMQQTNFKESKSSLYQDINFKTQFLTDEIGRNFSMIDTNSALVKITTIDKVSTQAAYFVDGKENFQFIGTLFNNPNSKLGQLRKKLELENCETNSTSEKSWIDGCGSVEITTIAQTQYGRGGWMEAAAQYTFFVGFRNEGSGNIFNSSYYVTFTESVTADVKEDSMEYNGTLSKTLSLIDIVPLPVGSVK